MRIQLAAKVPILDVDIRLLDEADDLDVIGGADVLHACEGAFGDKTGSMTGFRAPGDFLAFGVGDDGVGFAWCPKTKVCAQRNAYSQRHCDE